MNKVQADVESTAYNAFPPYPFLLQSQSTFDDGIKRFSPEHCDGPRHDLSLHHLVDGIVSGIRGRSLHTILRVGNRLQNVEKLCSCDRL